MNTAELNQQNTKNNPQDIYKFFSDIAVFNHINYKTNSFKKTLLLNFLFFALFWCLTLLLNDASATSQGELGNQSSASVKVSVQVNQSLRINSPHELLIDQTTLNKNNSRPLCVMHHGYSHTANVPYELTVDDIAVFSQMGNASRKNRAVPSFDIFLNDSRSPIKKQRLTTGMSLTKQSQLSFYELQNHSCDDRSAQLSIEMSTRGDLAQRDSATGLLILLVSPY